MCGCSLRLKGRIPQHPESTLGAIGNQQHQIQHPPCRAQGRVSPSLAHWAAEAQSGDSILSVHKGYSPLLRNIPVLSHHHSSPPSDGHRLFSVLHRARFCYWVFLGHTKGFCRVESQCRASLKNLTESDCDNISIRLNGNLFSTTPGISVVSWMSVWL